MKLYTEEQVKDLEYWKNNAEEDYVTTPISVLRYISELEKLKPIEPPNDEEIDDKIEDSSYSLEYDTGFRFGAKWVIEQIKVKVK